VMARFATLVGLLCLAVNVSAFVTPTLPRPVHSVASSGALSLRAGLSFQPGKVVVLGGAGFVGSRVCKTLVESGCSVTSVSLSGVPPEWAKGEPWVEQVQWTAGDAAKDDLKGTMSGAKACVSCVGVIGFDDEYLAAGNGPPTVEGAKMAKAAGVPRFVYVSVADAVRDNVGSIALKGYFAGKKESEAAIAEAYGADNSLIVCPGFVYGGDSFAISPPRVNQQYGSFVENTLSLAPFKALAGVLPGVAGLALQPPVCVDDVAKAVTSGALGLQSGRVDGTESIKEAGAAVQSA